MMPDMCFWYLPTYDKILAHVRDQVWQFYGNYRTQKNGVFAFFF